MKIASQYHATVQISLIDHNSDRSNRSIEDDSEKEGLRENLGLKDLTFYHLRSIITKRRLKPTNITQYQRSENEDCMISPKGIHRIYCDHLIKK